MNVQELIDQLQKVKDKSLPVAVYTDHGQCAMEAFRISLGAVEDSEDYMMDLIDPDDWEECEIDGPTHVVIEG